MAEPERLTPTSGPAPAAPRLPRAAADHGPDGAVSSDEMALGSGPRGGGRAARLVRWAVVLAVLVAATVGGMRAYERAHAPVPPRGIVVRRGDVVQKTQATGRLVPRQEVFVRPLVSGMLVELRVHPGEHVRRGDHLATVQIVADPVALGDARTQIGLARMRAERAARELERARAMAPRELVSRQALAQAEDDARLARAEVAAAERRAQLIAQGSARGGALRSNRVLAPIDGTVLAVPVNVGDFVSETSGFRDGTTVAALADMSDLVFKGQIEEAYVGQLRLGMPVTVRVGALPNRALRGTLQWISPRATIEGGGSAVAAPGAAGVSLLTASSAGVTRFELWAAIERPPGDLRAGYSAAAEVELSRRDGVVRIEERALRFAGERAFATPCAGGPEQAVDLGISDGIYVEVLRGLREGECVRARAP